MKFINLMVQGILVIGFASIGYAQQTVERTKVALMKTGNNTKVLIADGSSADFIKVLGEPSSVEDYYSEIDEDTLKLYHYGKNRLFFQDDELTGFEIVDASISIGQVDGPAFKVGDKWKLKNGVKSFYNFSIADTPGEFNRNKYEAAATIYLKNQGVRWDTRIELLFNSRGELFNIGLRD